MVEAGDAADKKEGTEGSDAEDDSKTNAKEQKRSATAG
jgi:hypothetical protein